MKMKKCLGILGFMLFFILQAAAQFPAGTKEGGYTSASEFLSNNPQYKSDFEVIKRTRTDILMWAGNDYKVETKDKQVKTSVIKKELWGVFKKDTLYLNAKPLTGYAWYAKVEVYGKYCFLKPEYPFAKGVQEELGMIVDPDFSANPGSGLGGAIGGGEKAVMRLPLIYNMQTAKKQVLSKTTLLALLEKYPNVKARFEAEPDMKSEATLVKYLITINELEK